MAPTSDFDPWMQTFTLLLSDGKELNVSMQDVNAYRLYTARLSLAYGSQIGATLLLLLVLCLLTRAEKRKSGIFIVNALCLLINAMRCILLSCYVTSSLWHPYPQLTQDLWRVSTTDINTSIAASVLTLMVTVLIMISLSVQVWVVCITTAPYQRYIIMGATTFAALVAIAYKFALVVIIILQTLHYENDTSYQDFVLQSYITQAVAIGLYSCIFTYKLGYAIVQRRKLKMPQFGPMQIIFIMGCQTMVIPGTFPPMIIASTLLTHLSHLHRSPVLRQRRRTRHHHAHSRLHLPPPLRHLGRHRQRESRRYRRTQCASPPYPRRLLSLSFQFDIC
jgi:pheromone alpha factor receptor